MYDADHLVKMGTGLIANCLSFWVSTLTGVALTVVLGHTVPAIVFISAVMVGIIDETLLFPRVVGVMLNVGRAAVAFAGWGLAILAIL